MARKERRGGSPGVIRGSVVRSAAVRGCCTKSERCANTARTFWCTRCRCRAARVAGGVLGRPRGQDGCGAASRFRTWATARRTAFVNALITGHAQR